MMRRPAGDTHAPRLVVKILGFSFAVTAAVLATVFLLLTWQTRARLTRAIVTNLEASQQRFADLESRRQAEERLQAVVLAESPTLKAAVDTYASERSIGGANTELLGTIRNELTKLQQVLDVPALSVTDLRGAILASAGPRASEWRTGERLPFGSEPVLATSRIVVDRGATTYVATVVPLSYGADVIADFVVATPLDDAYARELAHEARADVAIVIDGRVVASSLPAHLRVQVTAERLPGANTVEIGGEEYVTRRLLSVDGADTYALSSISGEVRAATSEAGWVLVAIGIGALLLSAAGSWWLARTLARPIDQLRLTMAQMAEARDFERPLPPSGSSLELDALTATFDALRGAVSAAEAESESAYLGVIGALAAALDARDPYTAGHSERVARLSVAVAREMGLSEQDIETIRLGALLHDIGKIGVSDAVLRKPGTLTDEEFEQIKQHPGLGARILKPLNFLAEQIAIVELHHERPDGRGYPYGLRGDRIPLLARIVHVVDAFDAMTSARAYRPGRPVTEAMAELWHHAGTSFDMQVVQAMAAIPPSTLVPAVEAPSESLTTEPVGGSLLPFRLRAAGGGHSTRSAG